MINQDSGPREDARTFVMQWLIPIGYGTVHHRVCHHYKRNLDHMFCRQELKSNIENFLKKVTGKSSNQL